MANRCKAKTNAGHRCRNSAGDNGLCGTHRKWESNGGDPFGGHRKTDVRTRLRAYLDRLKKGLGRRAAAACAHISYDTVLDQRRTKPAFAVLETEAEQEALGEVTDALFANACTGNVGAVALWLKYRHGWSDVSRVEVTNQVRQAELSRVLEALEAAGVTEEQLAAAQAKLEGEDAAGTVH